MITKLKRLLLYKKLKRLFYFVVLLCCCRCSFIIHYQQELILYYRTDSLENKCYLISFEKFRHQLCLSNKMKPSKQKILKLREELKERQEIKNENNKYTSLTPVGCVQFFLWLSIYLLITCIYRAQYFINILISIDVSNYSIIYWYACI